MKFVWLPKAIANRHALIDYITLDNLKAAIEQDSHIDVQTDQLAVHPEIGRPGRKQGTHELVITHTNFVVVYRVKPRTKHIVILRVLHTSQAWPAESKN